jgi:hypothetical protein
MHRRYFPELLRREADLKGQEAGGVAAQVSSPHLEKTTDQQSGADQQHQGERELSTHQGGTNPMADGSRSSASSCVLQCSGETGVRRMQSGRQSKDDSGQQRNPHAEQEYASVDGDFVQTRKPGRRHRDQHLDSPPREEHAEHAAEEREYHTLRDELAEDAAATGPESAADCDLGLT